MNWRDIILTSSLTTAAMGVLGFLLEEWLSTRLTSPTQASETVYNKLHPPLEGYWMYNNEYVCRQEVK